MNTATMWKDLLASSDLPQPIVNPHEIDEVVALVHKHRIDFQLFGGNLLAIVFEGRSRIGLLDDRPAAPTSPSVQSLTNPLERPAGMPLWILAAFPDVVIWLQEMHSNYLSEDDEKSNQVFTDLYGLDPNLSEDNVEKELINPEGHVRTRYYAHVIDEYVKRTGKLPEATVREGSATDIYTAQKVLNAFGEDSNFTLIARNTAMCYLQLHNSYKEKFPNETALIACAGAVDAMAYLVGTHQVDVQQIVSLSLSAAGKPNHLLEFIIQLEALLLGADTPNVSPSEVIEACQGQTESINNSISEVLLSGKVSDDISAAVHFFINDRKFKRLRNKLSISKR